MSRRNLPPLSGLRGFEAAARHLSFTMAAEELSLTQGAVSRQVRQLERFIGRPLFHRMTRQIALTREGEDFYRAVNKALSDIERATAVSRGSSRRHLTISVLPTVSSQWLMPRLHKFTQAHTDIEVTTISSIEPADLLAHDADVAIRVGQLPGVPPNPGQPRIALEMLRDWSGVRADELFPDLLVPVCAPSVVGDLPPLGPEQLLRLPLIHTSTRPDAWTDWFAAQNIELQEPPPYALEFGHFFMSLDAAQKGHGVALVPTVALINHPGFDQLVDPTDRRKTEYVHSNGAYYMLFHEVRGELERVKAFREWLLEEAACLREKCRPENLMRRTLSRGCRPADAAAQ